MGAWMLILLESAAIAALKITPITEPSIFIDHIGTPHNLRGVWETKIHTRIYPTNDSQIVRQFQNKLNDVLNSRKTLNKFVEETLLISITLVQNIINRYQSFKIDPLSQLSEFETMKDVKINVDNEITLERPSLIGKEIIEGQIILYVEHLAIESDKFQIFGIIPVPNIKTLTMPNVPETRIAVNSDNITMYTQMG